MLVSAAEVLRERGAAGVTINEVLTRSGAPRGSVYHHFPEGRNQILTQALQFAGHAITTVIDNAAETALLPWYASSSSSGKSCHLAQSDFTAGCPVVAAAIGCVRRGPGTDAPSQAASSVAGAAH